MVSQHIITDGKCTGFLQSRISVIVIFDTLNNPKWWLFYQTDKKEKCFYWKKNLDSLPCVFRPAGVPFVLGGVMPTWAVMPLLQEPVWDICASAAVFWPVSSYWPWVWEEDEDDEGFQREGPLPGSMLASSSSSTFLRSSAPAQVLLTSCLACLDLLPFWDCKASLWDIEQNIQWSLKRKAAGVK